MISILNNYLDLNHYSHLKNDFKELFLSHPNYPSLYAITDTLNLINVENVAANIPKEQYDELPTSFLAIYNNDLTLVTKSHNEVILFKKKGIKSKISVNDFMLNWSGVIIAIEPNDISIQASTNKSVESRNYFFALLTLLGFSLLFNNYKWSNIFTLFSSAIGLGISILILQEKFGFSNAIVSKLCNINTNTSCDSVIKSNESKINKWVSFSDIPFLFFAINLLYSIFYSLSSEIVIGFVSVLSLPLILYSFWLQKFIIKKWCFLCLLTSLLIIVQAVYFLFNSELEFVFSISIIGSYFFVGLLVCFIWFFTKPTIEEKEQLIKETVELKKFKRNFTLFSSLSKDIHHLETFKKLQGVRFGEAKAPVNLTLFLSPTCGHCHVAFKESFDLVNKFPSKVSLNVLFNLNPENEDNPYLDVAKNLLAMAFNSPLDVEEAIKDWHIYNLDLDVWQKKWGENQLTPDVEYQLQTQYDWCSDNEFNFTPVKIINNKVFPEGYNITEVKYFLNDFMEQINELDLMVAETTH